MCNNCQKIVKTQWYVDNFDDKEVNKLYKAISKAVEEYQDALLLELLQDYPLVSIEKTTGILDNFFDSIKGLLEWVYLYWQKVWLWYVKKETKELEVLAWLDFDLSFDIAPTRADEYAKRQAGVLISNVNETTRAKVAEIVWKSINAWRTQNKLSQEIFEQFGQFSQVRAELIARQETALALWWWKYDQFIESSKNYQTTGYKKAYTQEDVNVRPEHQANADAWRIPANEEFPWTWSMHEPFDFNCRCVVAYRMFLPIE